MIIDFHTHILPPGLRDQRQRYLERDATFAELYADPKAKLATADDLVQAMDEDGVDTSVAMGIGWADHGLAREANDYIIESVRRYPERLVGFAGVNPAWGERAAHEAERCAQAGLKGVGELHPDTQAFDLADRETTTPLMEVVRRHGLILTLHSSEPVGHLYQGKGKDQARGAVAVHKKLSRRDCGLRPLGRGPALLRPHARGRRQPPQRLLRHGGFAPAVQGGGLFSGRRAGWS